MLNTVQGTHGTGFFSQAVSDYAKQTKPRTGQQEEERKTVGEFTQTEWERFLQKVDYAIEEYQDDLDQRKAEAIDEKKEQTNSYILGNSEKTTQELGEWVLKGSSVFGLYQMESIKEEEQVTSSDKKPEKLDRIDGTVTEEAIRKLLGKDRQAPYSLMADVNGVVDYNGVIFQCDFENNRICLGNVSDPSKCISVPLERGGCLVFNRDNIEDLSRAIGMFSPEDVKRIMQAIAQDAKVRQTQMQIEDETSGVEVLESSEGEEAVQAPQESAGVETKENKKENHNT